MQDNTSVVTGTIGFFGYSHLATGWLFDVTLDLPVDVANSLSFGQLRVLTTPQGDSEGALVVIYTRPERPFDRVGAVIHIHRTVNGDPQPQIAALLLDNLLIEIGSPFGAHCLEGRSLIDHFRSHLVAAYGGNAKQLAQLLERPQFDGHVDEWTTWGATGWVWTPLKPNETVNVEAMVGDSIVGQAIADKARPDIRALGKANDFCGFTMRFRPQLSRGTLPVFRVRAAGAAGTLLTVSWSEISGFVEGITQRTAIGWAWRPESPKQSLIVEALVHGRVIGRARADRYRQDLAESGRGTGYYGFHIAFSRQLSDGEIPVLHALRSDGATVLPSVQYLLPDEPYHPLDHSLPVDFLPTTEGAVDFISRQMAYGWAWLPDLPDRTVAIEARLGDRVIGQASATELREDLLAAGRGSGRYGFTLNFVDQLSDNRLPTLCAVGPFGSVDLPPPANVSLDLGEKTTDHAERSVSFIEGNVDYLDRSCAIGWAWLSSSPDEVVMVEAVLHGEVIGRAPADRFRDDLARWGKGTGRYGFELRFERSVTGPGSPVFHVHGPGGAEALPAPSLPNEPTDHLAMSATPALASTVGIEGYADRITRWEAWGWAWMPTRPDTAVEIQAILDGETIGRAIANKLRQDLLDGGKGTGHYGFHIVFDKPVLGDKPPILQPYGPIATPLGAAVDLPPLTMAERTARPRGTVEKLMAEHGKFTAAGSQFEEFNPNILTTAHRGQNVAHPRLIAFYLPQFHAIPENDRFWGLGFTEWRQLPRGLSRFPGHYQPRIPRDLGFYSLLSAEMIGRQFAMASAAGIDVFAFYYYWFNRHRVLEKPLDLLLESEIRVPFLIIWANENWTRTWDGSESSVLLRQDYAESDDAALVSDLARHFVDRRYFRIDGRPLFIIYNPGNIPDAPETIRRWRSLLWQQHELSPLIFMAQTFGHKDPAAFGLDGAIEFPPHKLSNELPGRKTPDAYSDSFSGRVIDYEDFVSASLDEKVPEFPLIKTAVPSWDNECRRPNRGLTLEAICPRKYEAWLRALIQSAMRRPVFGSPIVAINAWNEWAEGAYLEPDVHYGAAFLNATARAKAAAITYQDPMATARPRVSVILPNYNHAAFIVERIRSVLDQSVPPSEIIFLDDCSTDDSVALAREVLEAGGVPFRIILNESNSGCVFRQWVKGIALAQQDIIWIAETDDVAHPDFLLHLLPQFQREYVMAAFGHIRFIDQSGVLLPDLDGYFDDLRDFDWLRSVNVPAYRAFSFDFTVKNVVPNASGFLFRKPQLTAAETERLYEYRFAGDWYFYALVLRGGCLAYARAAQSLFRLNRTSASRSAFFTDRHLREHCMIVEDLWREYSVGHDAIAAHAASLAQYLTDRSAADIEGLLTERLDSAVAPMRICVAAHSFDVGGGEVLPVVLANELRRLGHHVTYLVIERPDSGVKPGIRHRLRADIAVLYWNDVKDAFADFLGDYGIQVFNSHNVSVDYRLALLRHPFSIPYVGSLHGGYETVPDLLTDDLFNYLRETVTSWLYLSEKNLDTLRKNGVRAETFTRSFNAVPDHAGEWIDRAAFRAEHNIPANAFVLVLCSRAIEEKGWSLAVEICAMLAAETERSVRLVLIGDGPAAARLRNLPAEEMRNVTLLGQVDMPLRYFRCFDAAIFPSTFNGETFPLFLLECFLAGLPVASTDIGEIAQMMGGLAEQPGPLIDWRASRGSIRDAFVAAVKPMVTDAAYYAKLSYNARVRAEFFSVEALGRFYVQEFTRHIPSQSKGETLGKKP